MAQEIERKFLVTGDFHRFVSNSVHIVQGYLNSDPERTVRVRIKGNSGFITIKGKANEAGTSRYEWEKEIALNEAIDLIQLCEPGVIDKVRHLVKVGSHTYEIDVFQGNNIGLIIAEIELGNEDDTFEKPQWLGEEVTGNPKYYNSMLVINPFTLW